MRIKIKIKAIDYADKDIKNGVVSVIKETEEKFPSLELVHISGFMKNELKLFNLDEDRYVNPKEEIEFINELNSKLNQFNYMAYAFSDRIIIDLIGSRSENEEKPKDDDDDDDINLEELDLESEEDEDTRYRYGASTGRKLEEFIARYGEYIEDGEAELNYNMSKSKWGPRFRYNRDNPPSNIIKEEIKQYITDVFYN